MVAEPRNKAKIQKVSSSSFFPSLKNKTNSHNAYVYI